MLRICLHNLDFSGLKWGLDMGIFYYSYFLFYSFVGIGLLPTSSRCSFPFLPSPLIAACLQYCSPSVAYFKSLWDDCTLQLSSRTLPKHHWIALCCPWILNCFPSLSLASEFLHTLCYIKILPSFHMFLLWELLKCALFFFDVWVTSIGSYILWKLLEFIEANSTWSQNILVCVIASSTVPRPLIGSTGLVLFPSS